jgi:hypothetical protein
MDDKAMMQEVESFIDSQSDDEEKLNQMVLKLRDHLGYKDCAFYAFRNNKMKELGYLSQELETKIEKGY